MKKSTILLILFVLVIWGCKKKEPSDQPVPYNDIFTHHQDANGKVTVREINVANLLNVSNVKLVPAEKWKNIEEKIIPGEREEFPQLDMTLKELISLLGPAYHKNQSLQTYYWYFSNGKVLAMGGLYHLAQKPADISIEKYNPTTFESIK